ncbi:MAG: serine/threonine protein kinase [Deltaproteobacteria bacterium]|nr:serine/threonine protein kinase [Deltaproteobacteria bacterium]
MPAAPASLGALARGTRFGSYEIVRPIGGGGMGSVYEALHVGLGKRVALKTLHAGLTSDRECVERFLREGRASARLRHPNVVDVTDVGVHDGVPFLVMELLEGDSLADILEREGPLSPARALELLLPVASTLAMAHAQGVLHRDLKPDNVFVARSNVGPPIPKLLDFGISKVAGESTGVTGSGEVLGTPYYMSPEQTRGVRQVTAKSDQYALAVVLYECLTGARPFEGANVVQVLAAINAKPIPPPRGYVPALPTALEDVILKAMSREPEQRFDSVGSFATALLAFSDETTRRQWQPVFAGGLDAAPQRTARAPSPLDETAVVRALDGPTLPDRRHDLARRWPLLVAGALLGGALVIAAAWAVAVRVGDDDAEDEPTVRPERTVPTRPVPPPPLVVPARTGDPASAAASPASSGAVSPSSPCLPPECGETGRPPSERGASPAPSSRTKQRRIPREPVAPPSSSPSSEPRMGRNGAPIVR